MKKKRAHPRIEPCPQCRAPMEQALCEDCLEIHRPVTGDLAVCLVCAAALIFTTKTTIRVIPHEQLVEMDPTDRDLIIRAQIDVARLAVKH